jgi:type VI secretion system protein ImpH
MERNDGAGGATPGPEEVIKTPPLPEPAARYDFFQAVRLLESRWAEGPRLGERGPAAAEHIRLRPSTSLGFPAADVESIRWIVRAGVLRAEVTACFLGLYGSSTPLPRSYAEDVRREERERPALRDFLDIFHHRLLSLLYRGWLRCRYEQAFEPQGRDALSRALLLLAGVDPDALPASLGMEPVRALHYLGLLLQRARPASGLTRLLGEELGVPLRIEACPARWIALAPEERFRFGAVPGRGALGHDVVIGTRRLDRMGSVRIVVGPVGYQVMRRLAPGGVDHGRLAALVRLYARRPLDVLLDVEVPAQEVPPLRLGGGDPGRIGVGACMGRPCGDPVVFHFLVPAHVAAGGGTAAQGEG